MNNQQSTLSTPPSHWKLLACDLDGTLIGLNRIINDRDLAALRRLNTAALLLAI